VLKKHDGNLAPYDLGLAQTPFLRESRSNEPTHAWIAEALGKPVIDHYWQTEPGWPILSSSRRGKDAIKLGSRAFPSTATT